MARRRMNYKIFFALSILFLFIGLVVTMIPLDTPIGSSTNENDNAPLANLSDNPSATDNFETQTSGIWSIKYTWTKLERVTTDPFEGAYCLKIGSDTGQYQLFTNDFNDKYNLSSPISQYPFIRIAMKIPKGVRTTLIAYLNNSVSKVWWALGKSPLGVWTYDGGPLCQMAPKQIELIDDNEWHLYQYDLSQIPGQVFLELFGIYSEKATLVGDTTNDSFYIDYFAVTSSRTYDLKPTTWWNMKYDYRLIVNVTEPNIATRINEPVHLQLRFDNGKSYKDSLVVAYYYSGAWQMRPSQIWNVSVYGGTNYYQTVTLTFLADLPINCRVTYYVYYASQPVRDSNYSSTFLVDLDPSNYVIETPVYKIGFDTLRGFINQGYFKDYSTSQSVIATDYCGIITDLGDMWQQDRLAGATMRIVQQGAAFVNISVTKFVIGGTPTRTHQIQRYYIFYPNYFELTTYVITNTSYAPARIVFARINLNSGVLPAVYVDQNGGTALTDGANGGDGLSLGWPTGTRGQWFSMNSTVARGWGYSCIFLAGQADSLEYWDTSPERGHVGFAYSTISTGATYWNRIQFIPHSTTTVDQPFSQRMAQIDSQKIINAPTITKSAEESRPLFGEGIGEPLKFYETGYTSNDLQSIKLSSASTGQTLINIPPTWQSKYLRTEIVDLFENISRLPNTFWDIGTRGQNIHDAGYGTNVRGTGTNVPTGWGYMWQDLDGSHSFSDEMLVLGYQNYDGNPSNYEIRAAWRGDNFDTQGPDYPIYEQGTYALWNTTVTLNRGEIMDAKVAFNYSARGWQYSHALAFISINDVYVWTRSFATFPGTYPIISPGYWYYEIVSIPLSVFPAMPGKINLKLGVQSTISGSTGGNGGDAHWTNITFSDCFLFMQTKVRPSQIQLKMDVPLDGAGFVDIPDPAVGIYGQSGVKVVYPNIPWYANQYDNFPIYSTFTTNVSAFPLTPGNPPISMKVSQKSYGFTERLTSAQFGIENPGTTYTTSSTGNAIWTFYIPAKPPSMPPPQSDIQDYVISFPIPADWTITQVWNPQAPPLEKLGQSNRVLKVNGTGTDAGNRWFYPDILHPDYTTQPGDYLYYDIMFPSTSGCCIAGVDLEFATATLRGSGAVDQNGLSAHPATNLIGYANNRWYRRQIAIPSGLIGMEIDSVELALEQESTYTEVYIRNAYIGDAQGRMRFPIYISGTHTFPSELYGPGNNGFTGTSLTTKIESTRGNFLFIPNDIANIYGYWKVIAESPNYVLGADVRDGVTNNKKVSFQIGDLLRINASIKADPSGIYAGTAKVVINTPSGATWYTETKTVTAGGQVVFSNIRLSGLNSSVGEYVVTVTCDNGTSTVGAMEAGKKVLGFNVTHNTSLSRNQPLTQQFTSIAGETGIFKIRYYDTDAASGIIGANLTFRINNWNGLGNHYIGTMVDYGNGIYTGEIDTSNHKGLFNIDVIGQKRYFTQQTQNSLYTILVIVDTDLSFETIPSTPYHENTTLILHYTNSSRLPVLSAIITSNQIHKTPQYNPATGTYSIEIKTDTWLEGTYSVQINCSKLYHLNQSVYVSISIRAIQTLLTCNAPSAVPFGQNTTFPVRFTVQDSLSGDDGLGIPNIDRLTINGSLIYSYNPVIGSPGSYALNIDTSKWAIGTYYINVSVYKQHYYNKSLIIQIQIRAHFTEVTYTPVGELPWGHKGFVTIFFRDTDLGSQLINGPPAQITGNGSQLIYNQLGTGTYNITLNIESFRVGTYLFNVKVYQAKYQNSSVIIPIRIREHLTSYSYDTPSPTPFGLNATISLYYSDIDINSNPGIPNVLLNGTIRCKIINPIILNPTYQVFDMKIQQNGKYNIVINTSSFPYPAIYTLEINITWFKNSLYQNQTYIYILFQVGSDVVSGIGRRTELIYDTPTTVPFGDKLTLFFYYNDIDDPRRPGINNFSRVSMSLRIVSPLGTPTPIYWINDLGFIQAGKYSITIDTRTLPGNNTYIARINITYAKVPNFYQNQSIQLTFVIRINNSLLTYSPPGNIPWSNEENATIMVYYYDIDHNVGISGATINLKLVSPLDISLVKNKNWTVTDEKNGYYTIEIIMENLTERTYTFEISANKTYHVPRTLSSVSLTIRNVYTALTSPDYPSNIIPIGLYNITIIYSNKDKGINIQNDTTVNVTIFTYDSNSTWRNQLSRISSIYNATLFYNSVENWWVLQIDTTNFNLDLSYNLTVWIEKVHYESQGMNITLNLKKRESIMGIVPPSSQVWGENVTFTITYTNLNEIPIPSTVITINWTKSGMIYYTIVDELDGNYTINLNTSAKSPGSYILEIKASAPGYMLRSMQIPFLVRPIDTQIVYQTPSTTAWANRLSFWLEYRDIYHGMPINGTQVSLSCNLTSSYWNWDYDPITKGRFNFEINTTFWPTVGRNLVTFTVTWKNIPYYQNQTVLVFITTRSRSTELDYQPPESIQFGSNATILIRYRDLDNNSIAITNSSSWGPHMNLKIYRDNGNGQFDAGDLLFGPLKGNCWIRGVSGNSFEIIINSSKLEGVGSYNFWIQSNWIGKPYFSAALVMISLTVQPRNTELNYISPGTIGYGLNATIDLTYVDIETSQGIESATITILDLYKQKWNSSGFAWVNELGSGNYRVVINTSKLAGLDSYDFTIWGNWTGKPFYKNSSISITIRTRIRNTELLYVPPPAVPFGDKINITVYYNDLDSGLGIDNSTRNIALTIKDITLYSIYNLNFEQQGKYVIEIDTNDVALAIGSFNIQINALCFGKPYYTNKSILVGITVRKITSYLRAIDYQNVIPWNTPLQITCIFNDTDHNYLGIPVYQANVTCSWPKYSFENIGLGAFRLHLATNYTESNYLIWIFVNQTNYESKNITVSFTIRKIYTSYYSNVSVIANWPWRTNFTACIGFLDIDNNLNVSGLSQSNIKIESKEPWNNGRNCTVIFNTQTQRYYIEFNTTFLVEGTIYYVNITLFQTHYFNKTFQLNIRIRYPSSSLYIKDILPGTTVAWGDNLTIIVSFNDTETMEPLNGTIWLEPFATWPKSYYTITQTVTGRYTILLNTTYNLEGSYQLNIMASARHYHNTSTAVVITIRRILTNLETLITPSYVYFIDNTTILLQYNDTEPGHSGLGLDNAIFNVYWKDIGGTLHKWSGPEVRGSYRIIKNATAGQYTLVMNSSSNLGIGTYQIYVNCSLDPSWWGNLAQHYQMGSTIFTLRVLEIATTIFALEIPSTAIPWNDTFSVLISYNDTVHAIGLSSATVSVNGWPYQTIEMGFGIYNITIRTSFITSSQLGKTLEVRITANKTNYAYRELKIYVVIRPISSRFSFTPPDITPYNNTVNIALTYFDLDHTLPISNVTGAVRIGCNITGWGSGVKYRATWIGDKNYLLTIDTSTLPYSSYTYVLNINVVWCGTPYYYNHSIIINLIIRDITTLLWIEPIAAQPWGFNVTLTAHYIISDSESIHDGQPVQNANINCSYPFRLIRGIGGTYYIIIGTTSLSTIVTYNLWVTANYAACTPANETFSLKIRSRYTDLTYTPPGAISFSDIANITVYYIDLDNSSKFISNQTQNVIFTIYNSSGSIWKNNYAWTDAYTDHYIVHINTINLAKLGIYNFTVVAEWILQKQFLNVSVSFTLNIKERNTEITYIPPELVYYGDNSTITLRFSDLDAGGIGISNNTQQLFLNILVDNNPAYTQYWLTEIGAGYFTLKINTSRILTNRIGAHQVKINAIWCGKPFYSNRTTTIIFTTRRIYTDYTSIIGGINTLSYSGLKWGRNATVLILFNDTDRNRLVPNSNILVTGEGPYTNLANRPVIAFPNGTFILTVNGIVPAHGVKYQFQIKLYKDETFINQSFTVSLTFIKNITSIFIKSIDYSVPWGENATIIFSYNDTVSLGNPGVMPESVIIKAIPLIAQNYSTSYSARSLGIGIYVIELNTTWALGDLTICSFNITMMNSSYLPANTIVTITIRKIKVDLRVISYNYTIWKDNLEGIDNFNIIFSLKNLDNRSFPINNNSLPQYENIKFFVVWASSISDNEWEHGTLLQFDQIRDPALPDGYYRLMFRWNPETPELIQYKLQIFVNGSHIEMVYKQIIFNLKIHYHHTAITTNWTYAHDVLGVTSLPYFPDFNGDIIYGDKTNITFYWYDLNASNAGISPAYIDCNWSANWFIVYSLYEWFNYNKNYTGLYIIEISTLIPGKNMIRTWPVSFNLSFELLDIVYFEAVHMVLINISQVPTGLVLITDPIPPTEWGENIVFRINYLNLHTSAGILNPDNISVLSWAGPSTYFVEWMGAGEYQFSLYSNVFDEGIYNVTIFFGKLNHEPVIGNFLLEIIKVNTVLDELFKDDQATIIYRGISEQFNLYYKNNKTGLQISFLTNFYLNWSGPFELLPFIGRSILTFNGTVPVGTYTVLVTANATHHQPASYIISVTVLQAPTTLYLIEERIDRDNLYQGDSIGFTVFFNNTYGEFVSQSTVFYRINISGTTTTVASGILNNQGEGIYSIDFDTWNLGDGDYDIEIYGIPTDTNYSRNVNSVIIPQIHVLSTFKRPLFIALYIIGAVALAFVAYRQVRWYLTPYQVKAIIKAKNKIRKHKEVTETKVVMDREQIFATEFRANWEVLNVKPPKLVKPEIIAFATELTSILRSRVTSSEAEMMITRLRGMSIEEATTYLASIKVAPEATRRLLGIIGMIKMEKAGILNFAQALGNIKGIEINYSQAEEIYGMLHSLSFTEADRYLEAMVIPKGERKKLLESIGITLPFETKLSEKSEKSEKEKKKKQ